MDNINFNLLKYFYYVAYYEGFTNASKQLRIAQSALSYNVKTLENFIQKTLIIRNSKNFELTEDGYELYETLKTVFGLLEKTILPSEVNNFLYEISIGIRYSLSDMLLKDFFTEFIEQNKDIHLNIHFYSKLDLKKAEDDYDIVIDYEDYTNLISTPNKKDICTLNNIIVSGTQLYENYKDIDSIKQLDDANFISLCPSKKKGKINKFCFENGISFKNIVSMNDGITSVELIKRNIGLSIINEAFVHTELLNEKLKRINIKEEIFEDKIVLVYKNNNKHVNRFIEALIKKYSEGDKK